MSSFSLLRPLQRRVALLAAASSSSLWCSSSSSLSPQFPLAADTGNSKASSSPSPLLLSPAHRPRSTMTMDMIRRASQTNGSNNSPLRVSPSGAEKKKPFLIGVAGGTASGKSTVCERIMQAVTAQNSGTDRQIVSLSQDSFYKDLDDKQSALAEKGLFNFDHPDAFDHELLISCLKDIQDGKSTQIPVYEFKRNARSTTETMTINPSDVVLLEGILVFYHKDVRDLFDMKLFVDTDADTRLARRVLRDIEDRGRDLEHILQQYTNLVKPAFEEFCLPTKKFADVIIPRGADNTVAIELVAQHIQDIIWAKNCSSKSGSPTFSRSRSNSDSIIR